MRERRQVDSDGSNGEECGCLILVRELTPGFVCGTNPGRLIGDGKWGGGVCGTGLELTVASDRGFGTGGVGREL